MRVDFARGVAAETRCPCRAHQIKSPGRGRGSEIWSYRWRSLLLQRSWLVPAELVVNADLDEVDRLSDVILEPHGTSGSGYAVKSLAIPAKVHVVIFELHGQVAVQGVFDADAA